MNVGRIKAIAEMLLALEQAEAKQALDEQTFKDVKEACNKEIHACIEEQRVAEMPTADNTRNAGERIKRDRPGGAV